VTGTNKEISGEMDIEERLSKLITELKGRVLDLEVETEKSQWHFITSIALKLHIQKIEPIRMGCFMPFKPTRKSINISRRASKYTINVRNKKNDYCVLYCIVQHLYKEELENLGVDKTNPKHLNKYIKRINRKKVEFPARPQDLNRLEQNNPKLNLCLNVWSYENDTSILIPYYLSKNRTKGRNEINMLRLTNESTSHVVYISDIDAFLRPHFNARKHLHCDGCKIFKTSSPRRMKSHYRICVNPNFIEKRFPTDEQKYLEPPTEYKFCRPVLRGYFDFETLNSKKIEGCEECFEIAKGNANEKKIKLRCPHKCDCADSDSCSHFYQYEPHVMPAFCYSLIIVNSENKIIRNRFYEGEDAGEDLTNYLMQESDDLMSYVSRNLPMKMTPRDQFFFDKATNCEACKKKFGDPLECRIHKCLNCPECPTRFRIKVRDHNHENGEYRAALCQGCNLNRRNVNFIPLYAHNLQGFDSHLVIKNLKRAAGFKVLARNKEKMISMNLGSYRFIDSNSFLKSSLDQLVTNLGKKTGNEFPLLKTSELVQEDGIFSEERYQLLIRKGVMPYEYLTSMDTLQETSLPPKENFYSSLKMCHISDQDYEHAHNVWKTFNCQNMSDYIRVYTMTDTILLGDVWQNFVNVAVECFKVDPECGYISLPQYAMDAFKFKLYSEEQRKISVLTEENKQLHDDISSGIRGRNFLYANYNNVFFQVDLFSSIKRPHLTRTMQEN